MRVRIVALGNPSAGDDGFGPAVLGRLQGTLPPDVELTRARDVATLAGCVADVERLIVIDAALGMGPPGTMRVFSLEEFAGDSVALGLSSHGLDVAGALALGKVVAAEGAATDIAILAVAADPRPGYDLSLSPAVEAAVAPAAARVRQLVSEQRTHVGGR